MKLDDEEPRGDRMKEKGLKREGEVSDREKAKCVWESFGAEVHCGRADSVSGGSEVWINASDWRRAAAVVREQNIRRREKRGEKMEGVQTQNFGKGDILRSCCMKESASKVEQRCKTAYLQNPNLHGIEAISSCVSENASPWSVRRAATVSRPGHWDSGLGSSGAFQAEPIIHDLWNGTIQLSFLHEAIWKDYQDCSKHILWTRHSQISL